MLGSLSRQRLSQSSAGPHMIVPHCPPLSSASWHEVKHLWYAPLAQERLTNYTCWNLLQLNSEESSYHQPSQCAVRSQPTNNIYPITPNLPQHCNKPREQLNALLESCTRNLIGMLVPHPGTARGKFRLIKDVCGSVIRPECSVCGWQQSIWNEILPRCSDTLAVNLLHYWASACLALAYKLSTPSQIWVQSR